ncbi:MAG TPA: DUF1844 domain-containing protein [Desulfonauticus sp.]|jgi:hypothetical protein|nr:MAG: hypothetical protein XD41_0011 [Desulfonauticus sp. 38_4375]MDK2921403.1 hypothetical protein [Desulfonauticus sp.]HCO11684.1 DUF1844 domain-containing protein [Desulfonauticus sp.]
MSEKKEEKIIVNDRRVKLDEEELKEEKSSESEARKLAQKKIAHDYAKVSAKEEVNLPKLDFATFVISLSSSALVHLGEIANPETNTTEVNLALAKQTIDLLGLLEEKTRGNLSAQEEKLLKDVLFDLRMKYIQKA